MDYSAFRLPVLEARPDWITCSARKGPRADQLGDFAEALAEREGDSGDQFKPWGFQGYHGWQAGAWRVGRNALGTVAIVSGDQAGEYAATLAQLADHWSRLDYCVTVWDERQRIHPDVDYWEVYRAKFRALRPTVSVTRIQQLTGGATLAVGSRTSALYSRVYDKHKESGGLYPPGAWRWEVECKRYASEEQHALWQAAVIVAPQILSYVGQVFNRNGLTVPYAYDAGLEPGPQPTKIRDADRTLKWFETQVRPAVEFAVKARGRDRVRAALGL